MEYNNNMKEIIEKTLEYAEKEVGVTDDELRSATGEEIRKYLNSAGIYKPAPWCGAFVYWAVEKASFDLNLNSVPFYRTAWCSETDRWGREKDLLFDEPHRGDVFLLYCRNVPRHTGFVLEVRNGSLVTVEANTGPKDLYGNEFEDFERYGVYRKIRPIFRKWYKIRKDITDLQDKIPLSKLESLFSFRRRVFTEEELRIELGKKGFAGGEVELVLSYQENYMKFIRWY